MSNSDIANELENLADLDARAGEPLGRCMRKAAQSIRWLRKELEDVLVRARTAEAEVDRLKAEIKRMERQRRLRH